TLIPDGSAGIVAVVDGQASFSEGVGERGAAVVGQGTEPGVDGGARRADQVAVAVEREESGAISVHDADEIVALAVEGAEHIRPGAGGIDKILSNDGILNADRRVAGFPEDAAALMGAVSGDGDIEQGYRSGEDSAALLQGRVAADSAVDQS